MKRLIKAVFTIIFAIMTFCYAKELIKIVEAERYYSMGAGVWFLSGLVAYIPIHLVFKRLIILHVFGHELTHALWAILSGGKVKEIYVSGRNGGFTTFTKGNTFVYLAPYFFPLYTIILTIIMKLAKSSYNEIFLFLIGLSISFHILLTIYSISKGQSDLKSQGVIFSLAFIAMMNCIVIGTLLCIIFTDVKLLDFLWGGLANMPKLIADTWLWTEEMAKGNV
jgi:hypothetical protein